MKVLFISNIPVPYRVDFYNELGKTVDLTVIFEAKKAEDQGIRFNYNLDTIKNFRAIFLSEGNIREKRIDFRVFQYLKEPYDRIILTSYSYYTEMAALIYLKMKKIPYFLSSDGGIIKYGENLIKRKYKSFLISNAKGYFSPSEKSDEYLIYYGADADVVYRYPFTSFKNKDLQAEIIVSKRKKEIRERLGINEKYMILGVGQFIHRKGWDILLKATKYFSNDIGVYIIGGEKIDVYENIMKQIDVNAKTHFLNFMDNETLKKYYQVADVFVLPTREDIWGLVVNEAMGCGLPVITTENCIAGMELVHHGENGYIINNIDSDITPQILAEYILKILNDENLQRKFSEESIKIIKKYTIEKMCDSYLQVILNGDECKKE